MKFKNLVIFICIIYSINIITSYRLYYFSTRKQKKSGLLDTKKFRDVNKEMTNQLQNMFSGFDTRKKRSHKLTIKEALKRIID